jgi:multidrug efflux system membrane fusion protein
MRSTYITSIIIAVLIGLWLYSGNLSREDVPEHPSLAQLNEEADARSEDQVATRVRARVHHASPRAERIRIRGRTQNKRTVVVKTEISGRIVSRPVERGAFVQADDLLCEVSIDDRQANLHEANEMVNQARIEYRGRLKLQQRGLQSETVIAEAKARLASAQAQAEKSRLALQRTRIKAPFSGFVEQVDQEIGDYVTPGSSCATIVDLDPMLLTGRVSEREVTRIKAGQLATARLADDREVKGEVSFVGQQNDAVTRTYAIEVQLPNEDHTLRSGITADIWVPVSEVMAQNVSPALFGLDDQGNMGIRILEDDSIVRFVAVTIVDEDANGVWVTGLPEVATVITVGQEMVVDGERVDVEFENAAMPVATPATPSDSSNPTSLNLRPVTHGVDLDTAFLSAA